MNVRWLTEIILRASIHFEQTTQVTGQLMSLGQRAEQENCGPFPCRNTRMAYGRNRNVRAACFRWIQSRAVRATGVTD